MDMSVARRTETIARGLTAGNEKVPIVAMAVVVDVAASERGRRTASEPDIVCWPSDAGRNAARRGAFRRASGRRHGCSNLSRCVG